MVDTAPEQKQRVRAQKFARFIKKGRNGTVKFRQYRAKPVFKRLKRSLRPLKTARKYERTGKKENTWDKYSIFKQPVSSERFYKKMESENTVIFFVDRRANKKEISKAFFDAFNVKPFKINTLVTPGGQKKAYIKLPKTNEASEIANKIGLI